MRILIALPDPIQAAQIQMEMENRLWETGIALHGTDVVRMHADFDIVLLHHCLQGMDGLQAGDRIAKSNPVCPPRMLLLCPSSLLAARPFWADWMVEPGVSLTSLCSFLEMMAQKPLPSAAAAHMHIFTEAAEAFLKSIGMNGRFKGHAYIIWLLERLIPARVSVLPLQSLYAACARHFHTSPASVERCVRIAVENVFTHGSISGIERYFGSTVDPERGKPTNRAFLLQAAEELRRQLLQSFTAARSPNKSEMHHSPAAPTSV